MLLAATLAGAAVTPMLLLLAALSSRSPCGDRGAAGAEELSALGASAPGRLVGATEYGGPGDPDAGSTGVRGDDLLEHPDTYAELGGLTWQTATAMGGLPYMTPLRVSWGSRSAIAYKRDIGFGGGAVDGRPRVIDLWWRFAIRLGIPYAHGRWSGVVRIGRAPAGGAGNELGQTPATLALAGASSSSTEPCTAPAAAVLPVTASVHAELLPDGLAAAPADAPLAVRAIIAAGNQIVGKPYLYGAAHGLPLSSVAPAYDCSSSVEHLLYGARLLPVTYGAASSALERFGTPGPGRWVTLYANADHVFMYVAGLRWDTHDAVGAGDGSSGVGWHPLVRSAAGFMVRHPPGL
jgi:hypothetical protein